MTKESVADRHSGTLGGRLTPMHATKAARVAVVLPPRADLIAQHTAWMTVNLLARAEKVVASITIKCDDASPVADNVIPFGSEPTLRARLVKAGSSIGVVPVVGAADDDEVDHHIVVGDLCGSDLEVTGPVTFTQATSWWGSVRSVPTCVCSSARTARSALPFGAYAAACLAVARVFLAVRLPHGPQNPSSYGWSMLHQRGCATADADDISIHITLDEATVLAGVGAVGCSFLHTLWAVPGISGNITVADSDPNGVTLSNLNRGVLFRRRDVGSKKATVVGAVATHEGFAVTPVVGDGAFIAKSAQLLISAVDTKRSRAALQQLYRPYVLSASTRDLRAEVLRVGPPGEGACLRCRNAPEPDVGDDDLRRRALDSVSGVEALDHIANLNGLTVDETRAILSRGTCDEVSERALARLRELFGAETTEFSVGFTSVFAGVMLAAETVKLLSLVPLGIDPGHNCATFQFLRPASNANASRPLAREAECPMCAPDDPRTGVWASRWRTGELQVGKTS